MAETVALQRRDLAGSRLRCLMLTTLPRIEVAAALTKMIRPFGVVHVERDHWNPEGLLNPAEIELGKTERFLGSDQRKELLQWWLGGPGSARLPTWDIVSTATFSGKPGLVLVEAKAHLAELSEDGKASPTITSSASSFHNQARIGLAIGEAKAALSKSNAGWEFCRDTHYQLSNRLAWAWKLASLDVPVALVYLGFLNAREMAHCGRPFESAVDWREVVLSHSAKVMPRSVWNTRIAVARASFFPLIRTCNFRAHVFE